MEGKRLLQSIRLRNLLSFGPEPVSLELAPLNVLIGPNASGKSNLIDALSLLQAAPTDLSIPTRREGMQEWLWKGRGGATSAEVHTIVVQPGRPNGLGYNLELGVVAQRLQL